MENETVIFIFLMFYFFLLFRRSQTFFEDFTGLRRLWQTIRLRDDDEATSGDAHRRKTVFLQSLRKTVHAKRKSQGKLKLSLILNKLT